MESLIKEGPKVTPAQVRFLRDAMEYSQEELAKDLNTGQDTVSCWENGKRKISKAYTKHIISYAKQKGIDLSQAVEPVESDFR